jgi:putative ABC transport system permease protein
MSRILRRWGIRHLLRHPWQLGLSLLGIALGVAVVVAIDLANESARRAFDLSIETVAGQATHRIVTGLAGLDETVYTDLRVGLGLETIAPVVEGHLSIPESGRAVRVLGVDPFADGIFRAGLGGMFEAGEAPLADFLVRPRTGVLAGATADRLGLMPGDELPLRVGTTRVAVRLIGILRRPTAREQEALGDLLAVDIATAQEILGLPGRLTRIDLMAPDGEARRPWLERIARHLPAGAVIQPSEGHSRTLASMTEAFRLNLAALSLLALFVGMFLIYNAMTFAVVQRRAQIGILRALGVTRRQIALTILGEAAPLGLLGTLAGVLLGIALGSGLLRLVATTINDLYFPLSVTRLHLSPLSLAKGMALGVGATLIAALVPALEAAGTSPRMALGRSILEERWRRGARLAGLAGGAVVLAGAAIIGLTERSLIAGFAGILGLITGFALIAPGLAVVLLSILRSVMARLAGALGALAARGVIASLSRTGVAIAALMTAVAVTVSVGIMIDSFRRTVVRWLAQSVIADVYVSPPGLTAGDAAAGLPPDLVERLLAVPGARGVASLRRVEVPRPDGGSTRLVVLGVDERSRPGYELREGAFETVWPDFRDGRGVLISQPYARRYEVSAGGEVRLLTDRGPRSYPVLGVYDDFTSEQGVVAMHRTAYLDGWDDHGLSGLAFTLEPGQAIEPFMNALAEAAAPRHEIVVQSNRAVAAEALTVFDRTFTVTSVLRLLTVVVAFVGVLSALMALQMERLREFGVLRALGLTPAQVWRLVLLQTGLMGLVAGLFSLPVGMALSWVMIHVINLRAFGWSLTMEVSPALLAQGLALALAAALLAGLYPAARLARASPASALREE